MAGVEDSLRVTVRAEYSLIIIVILAVILISLTYPGAHNGQCEGTVEPAKYVHSRDCANVI